MPEADSHKAGNGDGDARRCDSGVNVPPITKPAREQHGGRGNEDHPEHGDASRPLSTEAI